MGRCAVEAALAGEGAFEPGHALGRECGIGLEPLEIGG